MYCPLLLQVHADLKDTFMLKLTGLYEKQLRLGGPLLHPRPPSLSLAVSLVGFGVVMCAALDMHRPMKNRCRRLACKGLLV